MIPAEAKSRALYISDSAEWKNSRLLTTGGGGSCPVWWLSWAQKLIAAQNPKLIIMTTNPLSSKFVNRITLHPPTCRSAVYFRNWSAVPVAGLGSWMSKSSECSELYLYLQQRVCRRAEANGESIFGCLCLIFSCSLFSTLPNHLNQGNPSELHMWENH